MKRQYVLGITTMIVFVTMYIIFGFFKIGSVDIDYYHDLSKVPSHFVDHFPRKLMPNTSEIIISDKLESQCIYYMLFVYNNIEIKQLKEIFSEKSISVYNSSDYDLITIKDKGSMRWGKQKKIYYDSIVINNQHYFPIPYFSGHRDIFGVDSIYSNTPSGLSKDFTIYVIDAKPGVYLDGISPVDYLPKGWEVGYSKGVCISEKKNTVIYWFVVW